MNVKEKVKVTQGEDGEKSAINDANKRERVDRKIKGKVIFNDDENETIQENIV